MSISLLRFSYVWIGLSLSCFCVAQPSKTDSLQSLLSTLLPEGKSFADDTTRVVLLCALGQSVIPEKASFFLEQAGTLAHKINWAKGKMQANFELGVTCGLLTSYYRGVQFLFKALNIAEQQKDAEMQGRILYQLGNYYDQMGDSTRGLKYHLQALKVLPAASAQRPKMLNILGTDYYLLKNFKEAERYFIGGLAASKAAKNFKVESYCLDNLAILSLEQGDYVQSSTYLKEYEQLLTRHHLAKDGFYNVLFKWYMKQNKFVEAQKEAYNFYHLALSVKQPHALATAHRILHELYEAKGDTKNALTHYKAWVAFKEQNEREMKKKLFEALKFEYDNENQRIKIKNLDGQLVQKDYEQNLFIIGLTALGIILTLLFWNNHLLNRKNAQIDDQKNELTKLKDDLTDSNRKLLGFNETLEKTIAERTNDLTLANQELIRKNQEIQQAFVIGKTQERKRVASELHDNLGSTISGLIWQLQSVMPENLTQTEQDIYDGLIQQMRNAYTEIRHISHHLLPKELENGLISALERLLADLNRNDKTQFLIRGHLPQQFLSQAQETELYSICLEVINNTLKHAGATECILLFEPKERHLELRINDNGQGFDLQNLGNRGRGLANIEDRIKALNATIQIHSMPMQGTSFFICVPINQS